MAILKKESMKEFNFDRNLFTLEEEEHVSSYLAGPSWSRDSYCEIRKRVILYNGKPLIFSLPGRRDCWGICGNRRQYPYEYISPFFFSTDSNFFTLSNNILEEIRLIYPNIQSNYLQKSTIRIVIPTFVRFHRDSQIVEKLPLRTRFKIDSMRIGFSQVRFKYCDNYLQNTELELLAYEIYLA